MSLGPYPRWNHPATTWDEVIGRYTSYLQVRRWRGKAVKADGTEASDCLSPAQGARLVATLLGIVQPLVQTGLLSAVVSPADIRAILVQSEYSGRRFDKCPKRFWHLWRALIFNRDRYTCQYCLRSTWEVSEKQGRGLRFELDHRTARGRLSDCDDFDPDNIVTACRSCNVLKGQMDTVRFEVELESLACAVVRNRGLGDASDPAV